MRKPYRLVIKFDAYRGQNVHKLKPTRRNMPRSIPDITTDAIENLRAALDHAVYAIAERDPNVPRHLLRDIYFPFAAIKSEFPSRIRKRCPGFSKKLVALLCTFKPYPGGNDALWAINDLAIISKHKRLLVIYFAIIQAESRGMDTMGFSELFLPPKWDEVKNEFILGYSPRGTHVHYKAKLKFKIRFHDVPASLVGYSLGSLLNEMARLVDDVIGRLEEMSFALGIVK